MNNLEKWSGEFGSAYTRRNLYDPKAHAEFFKKILPTDIVTCLEVGTNVGNNLEALESLNLHAIGIEPNATAIKIGLENGRHIVQGMGQSLPWPDNTFDLVFTAGVLMHIPDYKAVMREIWRVSKKYVLSIEYLAEDGDEERVIYRGEDEMLWKRPAYLYPGKEIDSGHAPDFDNSYYQLFSKLEGFEDPTQWV